MPAPDEPDEREPGASGELAPPARAKNDPEAAQRSEDDVERVSGGLEEKAVEQAREQLGRLRDKK